VIDELRIRQVDDQISAFDEADVLDLTAEAGPGNSLSLGVRLSGHDFSESQ